MARTERRYAPQGRHDSHAARRCAAKRAEQLPIRQEITVREEDADASPPDRLQISAPKAAPAEQTGEIEPDGAALFRAPAPAQSAAERYADRLFTGRAIIPQASVARHQYPAPVAQERSSSTKIPAGQAEWL